MITLSRVEPNEDNNIFTFFFAISDHMDAIELHSDLETAQKKIDKILQAFD